MKVSVILATCNAENYICETLRHIQNQTYKDFECVIVDDESTDSTIDLAINQFCKLDCRFKILINTTTGCEKYSYIHNYMYSYTDADLVIHLDADDIPCSNLVETFVTYMVNNQDVDACCCRINILTETNNTWVVAPYDYDAQCDNTYMFHTPNRAEDEMFNKFPSYQIISNGAVFNNQCFIFRPERLKLLIDGGVKFQKSTPFADYVFWMTAIAHGATLKKISDPLLYWRNHASSASHKSVLDDSNIVGKYNFYYARLLCIRFARRVDPKVLQEEENYTVRTLRYCREYAHNMMQEQLIPDIYNQQIY